MGPFGGIRLRGAKADGQGMSSFQSLATAVAAQVGTGNLAGAATALILSLIHIYQRRSDDESASDPIAAGNSCALSL